MNPLVIAEQLRRDVPGGIGTYVRGLVKGLGECDVAPTLWASRANSSPDPLRELTDRVKTSPLPGRLITRAWDRGLLGPPAGFDVVHATSLAVPPRSKAPMTAFVHDLAWREFPEAFPDRGREWHEKALARALERASKVMVPSTRTADALMKEEIGADRIVVVTEGADHLPPPDHDGAQGKLDALLIEGDFVLAVGTIEPRKNLERLATAFVQARTTFEEPLPLVIVGPDGWGASFEPPEGVVLAREVKPATLAALYERCRVFVSVPLLEGFGLPVAEAMHAGAPVISTDVPSAGNASLKVDPYDVDDIAGAIALVVNDIDVREDLRARGSRHASMLTWKASAREHLRVWESLWP